MAARSIEKVVPVLHSHGDIPALWLHDLTGTAQVEQLLDFGDQAIEDGKATLKRLQTLHPEAAKRFAVKSSTAADIPFKLLSEMNQYDGSYEEDYGPRPYHSFDSFIAVSYCWRSDDWEPAESCQLPKPPEPWPLPISPRMLKAVLNFRSSKEEGIWIDQLCINQDNSSEKVRAINSMDAVYRSASGVIIVLEDADLTPDEEYVLDVLSDESGDICNVRILSSDTVTENFHLLSEFYVERAGDLVKKIFSCRWLDRVWCYHEFLLSQNTVILLPGTTGPEFALRPNIFGSLLREIREIIYREKWLELLPRMGTFSHHDGGRDSIIRSKFVLVCEVFLRSCTNLEDKITVGLNVANLGLNFVGNVKSEDDCHWIMASAMLCSGDATVLSKRGEIPIRRPNDSLYSWLKWPRNLYLSPSCPALNKPKTSVDVGISRFDFHSLTLDMLLLLSMPESPSKNSIGMATSFIRYCESSFPEILPEINDSIWRLKKFSDGSMIAEVDGRDERDLVIQHLACGLDNGIEWMAGAFDHLGLNDNRNTCFVGIHLTKQLLSAAMDHLFSDNIRQRLNSAFENGILKFLTVSLDPWSYGVTSGRPCTVSLDSEGKKWIILVPYSKLYGLNIVIPVPLANSSCSGADRVWYLEKSRRVTPSGGGQHTGNSEKSTLEHRVHPLHSCNEWVVVYKSAIPGLGEIKPNGRELVLWRKVRIVG